MLILTWYECDWFYFQELLQNDKNEEREYDQLKTKLQGICDKLDKEGNVKHFVLEEVSVSVLLLSTFHNTSNPILAGFLHLDYLHMYMAI